MDLFVFFFQAEDGIRDTDRSRVLGDVYKRQDYSGINVEELIDGFTAAGRFGYEETAYLLMFGGLPTAEELEQFKNILSFFRELPP